MIDFAQVTAALQRASAENEVTEDLLAFFDAMADLGRDPTLVTSSDGRAFLHGTAPIVRSARVPLHEYVADTERMARQEFYDDEWRRLCERRTKIEFVRTLYRDLVDVDWDESFMDVFELDRVLRHKGDEEAFLKPDQIPPGTPSSHWWWWYPHVDDGRPADQS
jgi:hypothetical protein